MKQCRKREYPLEDIRPLLEPDPIMASGRTASRCRRFRPENP